MTQSVTILVKADDRFVLAQYHFVHKLLNKTYENSHAFNLETNDIVILLKTIVDFEVILKTVRVYFF